MRCAADLQRGGRRAASCGHGVGPSMWEARFASVSASGCSEAGDELRPWRWTVVREAGLASTSGCSEAGGKLRATAMVLDSGAGGRACERMQLQWVARLASRSGNVGGEARAATGLYGSAMVRDSGSGNRGVARCWREHAPEGDFNPPRAWGPTAATVGCSAGTEPTRAWQHADQSQQGKERRRKTVEPTRQ